MKRFCQYCGKELNEDQDICLGCGKVVKRESQKTANKDHDAYYICSSIVMIILAVCLFAANGSSEEDTNLIFGFPALFALAGAICTLVGKKNKTILIVAGVLYLMGAFINFMGISDISIYAIVAVVFAIFNIVFASKLN